MRDAGTTPPFLGRDGKPVPGSIAEMRYYRLGGTYQWVMIRGLDVTNPLLVVLHGGPGMSEAPFFRYYDSSLEKAFTVLHWDQRGAAKSFDREIPRSTMTVERFLADLDELVDAVRPHLDQPKVVLFGHSWGSALGALYATRLPEKVSAYVGCGQVGDCARSEALSYAYALAEAERQGNGHLVKELRAIGPPPHTPAHAWTQRMCLMRLEGEASPRSLWKVGRAILRGAETSIFDVPDFYRGLRFSMETMWTEVARLNLLTLAPRLAMPAFVFVGRHDHYVIPETSVAYYEALTAPSKQLVWFEHSGHEPFIDEPDEFQKAMIDLVLPAARGAVPATA